MGILDKYITKVPVQEFEKMVEENRQLFMAREMLSIEISNLKGERYKGNKYQSYEGAVRELDSKYNSKAEWGVVLTGNIIDLRAAFIVGQGIKVVGSEGVKAEEIEKELEWTKDFFEFNKLDMEMPVELAKEAEIEGKICLKISMKKADDFLDGKYEELPRVQYLSWLDTKYTVETEPDDYMNYVEVNWTPTTKVEGEKLEEKEFVYNKFGGRVSKANEAQPKIMKCMTQIEDVDKAYRDWREINHLFASPVFDVECEDNTGVKDATKALNDYRMNINKGFVHSHSKLTIQSPGMSGVDSLMSEAVEKIKIISGTTGIPVHFLGLIDLLKNRSTGDNTRDMLVAGTEKERIVWKATWKEVLDKSMAMFNGDTKKTKLDSTKLDVEIPVYTEEQWLHIEKVLMPLHMGGALSLRFLLSQIPNVNVDEELDEVANEEERKAEEEAKDAEIRDLQMENKALMSGGGGRIQDERFPPTS